MKDRKALAIGVVVSILVHFAIIGLIAWLARAKPVEKPKEKRIEVSLVTEKTAPVPQAPEPSQEEPAPAAAPNPPAPEPQPEPEPPAPPKPAPKPLPAPKPVPKPVPLPKPVPPKPAPPKPAPPKPLPPKPVPPKPAPPKPVPPKPTPPKPAKGPTGNLNDLLNPKGNTPSPANGAGKALKPPAISAGELRRSFIVKLGSQIRPHWENCFPKVPDPDANTVDIDLELSENGGVSRITVVGQRSGEFSSNQAGLIKDCAKKAVTLAAPFKNLPPENYAIWKSVGLTLKGKKK